MNETTRECEETLSRKYLFNVKEKTDRREYIRDTKKKQSTEEQKTQEEERRQRGRGRGSSSGSSRLVHTAAETSTAIKRSDKAAMFICVDRSERSAV